LERLFNWISYSFPGGVRGGILWTLLLPLHLFSLLYGFAVIIRLLLYSSGLLKTSEIGCKVVSVGNITVGGTGKTPAVEFIVSRLRERGVKAAVLSRGYGGKRQSGAAILSDGKTFYLGPGEAGDEPYMLAKKLRGVPVLVGADRTLLARLAVAEFDPDILVLDDGFQHVRLKRDLDILLIDGEKGLGNGSLFPRGPLREPLSALKRAGIVLITKSLRRADSIEEMISNSAHRPLIFKSSYRAVRLVSVGGSKDIGMEELSGARIMALSAIADPDSFTSTLKGLGAKLLCRAEFPDHHDYGKADLEKINEEARLKGAEYVVTTGKDAVKIEQIEMRWALPLFSLEIDLDMGGKEADFIDAVLQGSGI